MYTNLFDELPQTPVSSGWRNLSYKVRGLIVGLTIVPITLGICAAAAYSSHPYIYLCALGLAHGALISMLLTQLLAPKFQTLATGFLGGISVENIAAKEARLRHAIRATSEFIRRLAENVNLFTPKANPDFQSAFILCMWIALITALVILAINTYYANSDKSPVGARRP